MSLTNNNINEYNKTRITANKSIVCHAPFQSINFTQNGEATVCCYNKEYVLGTYPCQTIHETWFGKIANELRNEMRKNPFPSGCQNCELQIKSENYAAVHARHYDFNSDNPVKHFLKKGRNLIQNGIFTAYPRVMEFELSNTCNLECVMCNGYFSSTILKNREKGTPRKLVFDDCFVDQLTEFIPHLTDAKFLGGEPFLIPIYFKIWEKIIEINPKCKLHITTNATLINEKSWEILNSLKSNIIVSIDSLNENNYNYIRKGASFIEVRENIKKLHDYTIKSGTDLNFSVCPMTINWQDMPEIIQYGIDNQIYIYFNTVFEPKNLSLIYIDQVLAQEIILGYKSHHFTGNGNFFEYNMKQINGLIKMIEYWHPN